MVRVHVSSGTTGQATVIYYTRADIEAWADLVARSMYMAGLRAGDVFQNMMGYGLFTGGLGFHYGAEPHTDDMRRRIEAAYGLKAYNSYGLSELNGPGVAFECPEQNGLHVWEDHFLLEVINPQTLEPSPPGEVGEVVLTNLSRGGMPVLRYRTRDLAAVEPGVCPCGRTPRRISRIPGRTDDMLIVKGGNIFPMQLQGALMAMPEVHTNYLVELTRENFNDP